MHLAFASQSAAAKMTRYIQKTTTHIFTIDKEMSGRYKLLIGECKFKNSPVTCADLENLKRKIDVTGRKEVLWYLFSKGGFSSDIIKLQGEGTVNLIGLPELAEEL